MLVNDYKEGLYFLENNPNLNAYSVNKVKAELLNKEREIIALQS